MPSCDDLHFQMNLHLIFLISTLIHIINFYLKNITLHNHLGLTISIMYIRKIYPNRLSYRVGFEKPEVLLFLISVKYQRVKGILNMC